MVCIQARCDHGVKSVDIDRPMLGLVLRGTKHLRCGTKTDDFGPGDLLAMAPGMRFDAVNRPDPADGRYLTLSVPLCDEVLAAARLVWPRPVQPSGLGFTRVPAGTLAGELTALADAVEADDELRARLAVLNVLAQLAQNGATDLLLPPAPSLSAQVRQLVAQAPTRAWQSTDFEQVLGTSGATLRRRLAAEGTALRELITHARLACALDLLYTTRWPVKTVADRVGYRSVESFTRRFRERYGLDASAIGNATPEKMPAHPH
jgi:AraC-like DNA-binding protein